MRLLRLPYFYFTGFLSGFLSLVPYLGIVLAPIPPLLAGADVIDAKGVVLVLAVVIILHVIAVNLLYPKVLGNRLHVNPVVLTIALLFWGWLWGGIGLLLAIPITAAMKIIFDHVASLRPYGKWMGTNSLSSQRRRGPLAMAEECASTEIVGPDRTGSSFASNIEQPFRGTALKMKLYF